MSNNNFDQLLMNAIKKCDGMFVSDYVNPFQLLYPFTTENIAGYIHFFNLSNHSLLTVGSSGDQIINASLFDCLNIVCLDICPYTKFYVFLKISCLLELNRSDFLSFLCYKNYPKTFKNNIFRFDNAIFKKIKSTLKLLDYESYLIWNSLFSTFKGLEIRQELFNLDENRVDVVVASNPYLQSDNNYEEARQKIKQTKLEFIIGDIFALKLNQSFDAIWLSNIGTYLSRHFLKILVDKMSKNLNDQGLLLISYLYQTVRNTPYQQDWSPIYYLERTFEILCNYKPELFSFIGVDGIKFNDKAIKDSVLVYKKINNTR